MGNSCLTYILTENKNKYSLFKSVFNVSLNRTIKYKNTDSVDEDNVEELDLLICDLTTPMAIKEGVEIFKRNDQLNILFLIDDWQNFENIKKQIYGSLLMKKFSKENIATYRDSWSILIQKMDIIVKDHMEKKVFIEQKNSKFFHMVKSFFA